MKSETSNSGTEGQPSTQDRDDYSEDLWGEEYLQTLERRQEAVEELQELADHFDNVACGKFTIETNFTTDVARLVITTDTLSEEYYTAVEGFNWEEKSFEHVDGVGLKVVLLADVEDLPLEE